MVDDTSIGGAARDFPETRWTLVRSASQSPEARAAALEQLLATYWKPIYHYVRRKGRTVEDAKDVVQAFCAHLLDRDFLPRLDPGKGRFRSYLRAAVDHFLINEHEKAAARKRGGGAKLLSLDVEAAERTMGEADEEPGRAFDRAWAAEIMGRSLARLRVEFSDGTRGGPFELVAEFFGAGDAPSYADAAKRHAMSPSQLKAFLHRARERFREIAREEVRQTVASAGDEDSEMTQLFEALR